MAEVQNLAVSGDGVNFGFSGPNYVSVLNELNISVPKGVIYGLLGPSGCGKTTLLRCIIGRHKPKSGIIKVFGKQPGDSGIAVPGLGVGFMPQELALYPEITAEETWTFFGRLYRMKEQKIKDRISFLAEFLDIPDIKKQIKFLSGGQQRRVSFAVAFIHKPPLLILDEPTVGVDPLLRKSIWNHLQKLATVDDMTIIITTHYVEEARQAQVVGLMRDGHLLAEANPETLISRYRVTNLEDVFLKLCYEDSAAEEALPQEHHQEDIWIRRADLITQTPMTYKNRFGEPEQSETALLTTIQNVNHIRIVDGGCTKCSSTEKKANKHSNRMKALMWKNFLRLRRNIPFVFFQVFIPAFQVIVFCLCVGGEPVHLPVAVVNEETDTAGKGYHFLASIDQNVIQQKNYSNLPDALDSVKRGVNWGVIHLNEYFTDATINRYLEGIRVDNETVANSTIMLYLDMTDQQIYTTIYSKVMNGFLKFAEEMLRSFRWNSAIASPPVVVGDPVYGDLVPNFTEYMAPGMILGITYIMAVGLSSMSIILEKKEGLLDRSWVAGVKSWEVIFSIFLTLFLVGLLQVALILVFTFQVFSIPVRGPLVWVVIAVLLTSLEGMSYGFFISSIVNDENIAMMIAMGSFYPNLLMSGIIWPIEAMPYILQQVSKGLPLTLIAHSMRSILSRGWDITDHGTWVGYVVCIAWIVPVILLSSLFFKYKK